MSNPGSGVPRTVGTRVLGGTEFRLVEKGGRFFGLADGKIVAEGDHEDEAWRLLLAGTKPASSRYVSLDGAKKLFLHHYPNGFASDAFTKQGERGYKWEAKRKLDRTIPLKTASVRAGNGEAALSVFNATDLLSPFEKMRIRDVLRGPEADLFIQAAARFTLGEDRKRALYEMEKTLKRHGAAKWTSVTYLPFLWQPEVHMFLKPDSTRDFAERTEHGFAAVYSSALDLRVYDGLLDLTATTRDKLADLEPRDNIDIQSFIWVVSGAYQNEAPRP